MLDNNNLQEKYIEATSYYETGHLVLAKKSLLN